MGALRLDDTRDAERKLAWLAELTVAESWRCRSYGTQLLGQAVQHCRDRGRETLCAPDGDEAARHFLRQQGFTPAEGHWERDLRFPPLGIRLLAVQ